jgi:DNA-binding transcriptional ArsR family regulator
MTTEIDPTTIEKIKARFSDGRKCHEIMQLVGILGNPCRFRVMCVLTEGNFTVSEIVDLMEEKPSNVSQQLKMMHLAGYLSRERSGKNIYYRLESVELRQIFNLLHSLFDK